MDKKQLKYYEDIALSDQDIRNELGPSTNIVLYPDLHKYRSLDELLGPENSAVLLYESKPNYGHWTTVFKKDPNQVEFFNSYGGAPDDSLQKINGEFRMESHQDYPYLTMLMYDSPYECTYNVKQFQEKCPDIRTCGRHVICRLKHDNMNLDQYTDYMDQEANALNTNYDGVVTMETI